LIAPANQGIRINRIGVSFKGISNTQAPFLVELVRQTSAGTMTAYGALGPIKRDSGISSSLQTTGAHSATSTEPTTGDLLASEYVHPQTGVEKFLSLQHDVVVAPGERIGLRVTADSSVDSSWTVDFEE